jgi:sugar phosphate permease
MVGIMVGSGLGFLGGWVAEKHHWNTIFVYLGVFGVIYSIILAFMLRDSPKNRIGGLSQKDENKINFLPAIKYLFGLRSYILILSCWALVSISSWLLVGWLPTYFQEHFNLSQGMAGIYGTSYFFAAAIAGLLLGGYWADRWSRSNPRARILVPAIGLCIAVPSIFTASYTGILPVAVVCFMLYSLTKSFFDTNMMPILCLVVPPGYRATGYGILNLVACIIGGIGLYAGGILRDLNINLSAIYQFAALAMIISIVILFSVKPKYTDPE